MKLNRYKDWLLARFEMTLQQFADAISPLLTGVGTSVSESEIVLSDNTTNDASTARHGFLKKLSNTASEFMNGAGNWVAVTKSDVGLGSVDNTSDASKPVSTATQAALDLKQNLISLVTPTGDVNGANTEFMFPSPPILVTYQGIVQDLNVDYTVSGSTVTFLAAPVSGTVKGLVSS